MWLMGLILILISFVLGYYTIKSYQGLPLEIESFSDWVSLLITDFNKITIIILILLLIIIMLNKAGKYGYIFLNKKNKSILSFEKTKGFVILLLVFDVYLYLFFQFKIFIIVPLTIYIPLTILSKK